jgi:hypothetical protein
MRLLFRLTNVTDYVFTSVENAVPALMGSREPLPVYIFRIINEDTGSRHWVLNCQARDARVFQPAPEDVEAETPEIGIHIARDFVGAV